MVDFLRETCKLNDKYSEADIFHVLGALDVNSVRVSSNLKKNVSYIIYSRAFSVHAE